MSTLLALVEYYAKQPAAKRRRTLRVAAIPAHHAGDRALDARPARDGAREDRADFQHRAHIDDGGVPARSVSPAFKHGRRQMLGLYGSPALEQLLVRAFEAFGVTTYAEAGRQRGRRDGGDPQRRAV